MAEDKTIVDMLEESESRTKNVLEKAKEYAKVNKISVNCSKKYDKSNFLFKNRNSKFIHGYGLTVKTIIWICF